MDIDELKSIINDMAVQHGYPGFELRSLKFGLPSKVTKAPARLFCLALQEKDPLIKLAALRWFQDRPGDAKKNMDAIVPTLSDEDKWVRMEAVQTLELIGDVSLGVAESIARLLLDASIEVQKAAAKACGKLHRDSQTIVSLLHQAAQSKDPEVRRKSQKALRKLGAY